MVKTIKAQCPDNLVTPTASSTLCGCWKSLCSFCRVFNPYKEIFRFPLNSPCIHIVSTVSLSSLPSAGAWHVQLWLTEHWGVQLFTRSLVCWGWSPLTALVGQWWADDLPGDIRGLLGPEPSAKKCWKAKDADSIDQVSSECQLGEHLGHLQN